MTGPFTRVAALDDLEVGSAVQVHVGGEPVCLVRMDADTVMAVHDTCSHAEYPLHEGWIGEGEIECALHGSMFDLETGKPRGLPATKPIPTYEVRIQDGDVLVDPVPSNDVPPPRH